METSGAEECWVDVDPMTRKNDIRQRYVYANSIPGFASIVYDHSPARASNDASEYCRKLNQFSKQVTVLLQRSWRKFGSCLN